MTARDGGAYPGCCRVGRERSSRCAPAVATLGRPAAVYRTWSPRLPLRNPKVVLLSGPTGAWCRAGCVRVAQRSGGSGIKLRLQLWWSSHTIRRAVFEVVDRGDRAATRCDVGTFDVRNTQRPGEQMCRRFRRGFGGTGRHSAPSGQWQGAWSMSQRMRRGNEPLVAAGSSRTPADSSDQLAPTTE